MNEAPFPCRMSASCFNGICWPSGVPQIYNLREPTQILQTKDKIVIIHQRDHQVQWIWLNQPHSKNVTPSWYATKQETGKVVPTWNYVTVHAWGKPQVIEDAAWLRRQLDDLTLLKEGKLPKPWAVGDAPEPYVAAQMKGIVGIEIPIVRIEGKWKVSQNRPEKDRAGVVAGLRAGGESAVVMADIVEDRMKR